MTARMVIGGAVIVAALATGAAAGVVVDDRRAARVEVEGRRLAEQAMLRAQDALEAEREALRLIVHSAATNPSLAAAIRGRVDASTLADLFATESWWAPYRELFVALTYDDGSLAFFGGDTAAGAAASALLPTAIGLREPLAGAFIDDQGGVVLGAARSIETGTPGGKAVLQLARRFDQSVLDRIARRAGGALVLSDGARALVVSGPTEQTAEVVLAITLERLQVFHTTRLVAVNASVGPGLWLWASADIRAAAREAVAADTTWLQAVWCAAGAIAFGAIVVASRGRRPRRSPSDKGALAALVAFRTAEAKSRQAAVALAEQAPSARTTGAFGRYQLLDRIGEGGMAEIYIAIALGARNFRRPMVIKRLRAEMSGNPEAVSHFIDEANLAASLVHPNLVPVFDFGQSGNEYFIAEEYILGRDLRRLVIRLWEGSEPPLSVAATLYIAHQLLGALDHAHGRCDADGQPLGIVHRDVSPQNTMISLTGEVKLLDFGIVKSSQGRVTHTEIGMVKGNVDFMSPEQARGREVDGRADLFSLGLLIAFSAMNGPLYGGETIYERLTRAALGPSPEDLERIAALPAPLPEILAKVLAVEPDERYATAAELRSVLEPHLAGGREDLIATMARLFRDDLRKEEQRLAARLAAESLPDSVPPACTPSASTPPPSALQDPEPAREQLG